MVDYKNIVMAALPVKAVLTYEGTSILYETYITYKDSAHVNFYKMLRLIFPFYQSIVKFNHTYTCQFYSFNPDYDGRIIKNTNTDERYIMDKEAPYSAIVVSDSIEDAKREAKNLYKTAHQFAQH